MVRSVAREYHWPPDKIGGFFIDAQDFFGLEFWYNDIIEANKDFKNKT